MISFIMSALLIVSFGIINVLSQGFDCNYGTFEYVNNVCMYDCEYDDNHIPISSLSFGQIRSECSRVDTAARIYSCTINDLVWPKDTCECPYCSCSSSNDGTLFELKSYRDGGPTKECFNCSCTTSSDSAITGLVYNCNELIDANDPNEWNDFQCPPITCTDSSGVTQGIRSEWFEDVSTSLECNQFCYCSPANGKICATGWSNIVASQTLSAALLDDCGYNDETKGCYDIDTGYDASRLFSEYTGPSCPSYGCPRCACPSRTVIGETWYHEFQDSAYDVENDRVTCTQCECKSDGAGGSYVDCDIAGSGTTYTKGSQTCPATVGSNEISCHDANSPDSAIVSTLSTSSCSIDNGALGFCTWQYDPTDNGNYKYEWRCSGDDVFCEAFANGECIFTNSSITYTDCYGATNTQTFYQYQKCCTGDNCNHENIDIDSCTQSAEYDALFTSYYGCLYDPNGAQLTIGCDDYVSKISCDDVEALFTQQTTCQCDLYKTVYNGLSASSQAILQSEVDGLFSSLSAWDTVLGCGIDLSCDLSETTNPTSNPTDAPTTAQPTLYPSNEPSPAPSDGPTPNPTDEPTTAQPTLFPSDEPSNAPSKRPTTRAPTSSGPTLSPSSTQRGVIIDVIVGDGNTTDPSALNNITNTFIENNDICVESINTMEIEENGQTILRTTIVTCDTVAEDKLNALLASDDNPLEQDIIQIYGEAAAVEVSPIEASVPDTTAPIVADSTLSDNSASNNDESGSNYFLGIEPGVQYMIVGGLLFIIIAGIIACTICFVFKNENKETKGMVKVDPQSPTSGDLTIDGHNIETGDGTSTLPHTETMNEMEMHGIDLQKRQKDIEKQMQQGKVAAANKVFSDSEQAQPLKPQAQAIVPAVSSEMQLPPPIPPVPGVKAEGITGPGSPGETPGVDDEWEYYDDDEEEQLGPTRNGYDDENYEDDNNELYVNHATHNGYQE